MGSKVVELREREPRKWDAARLRRLAARVEAGEVTVLSVVLQESGGAGIEMDFLAGLDDCR